MFLFPQKISNFQQCIRGIIFLLNAIFPSRIRIFDRNCALIILISFSCAYRSMYTTYANVDFSSQTNKYTKYPPDRLEQMINKFFDRGRRLSPLYGPCCKSELSVLAFPSSPRPYRGSPFLFSFRLSSAPTSVARL